MWRTVIGLFAAVASSTVAGAAVAAPPSDDTVEETTTTTVAQVPLVPVPAGCAPPPRPHVVFVGEVVDRDVRTIRYRIDTVRDGWPDPFAGGDLIDVRYGLDAQYLEDSERYLVSTVVDPDLGVLVSRVTEPVEHFGGDDVIGVSESDVDCPVFDDPMRTLHLDGTAVDSGVLAPLAGARASVLAAVMVPAGVAVGAIFLLASLRLSISGVIRGLVAAARR